MGLTNKKALLIGWDKVHTERYVFSLLFLGFDLNCCEMSKVGIEFCSRYGIQYVDKLNEEQINNFDLIILIGYRFKHCIIEKFNLDKFANKVIVESLSLHSSMSPVNICSKLQNCTILYAHLRKYETLQNFIIKQKNELVWYNNTKSNMKIKRTCMHILDFLSNLENNGEYKISNIERDEKNICFELKFHNRKHFVKIENNLKMEKLPKFNSKELYWPDYIKLISKMVINLLVEDVNVDVCLQYTIKTFDNVNKILKGEKDVGKLTKIKI